MTTPITQPLTCPLGTTQKVLFSSDEMLSYEQAQGTSKIFSTQEDKIFIFKQPLEYSAHDLYRKLTHVHQLLDIFLLLQADIFQVVHVFC